MTELAPNQDSEKVNVSYEIQHGIAYEIVAEEDNQISNHVVEGFPSPNIKHLGKLIHKYGGFTQSA